MWLPLAIISLVFSFVLMIIKMAQDHEKHKLNFSKGSDKSLTVSELNDIVAAAVEEAVEPLKERIRQLEQGESAPVEEFPALEPSSRRLNLDDFEEPEEHAVSSGRKKVR